MLCVGLLVSLERAAEALADRRQGMVAVAVKESDTEHVFIDCSSCPQDSGGQEREL